MCNAFHENWQVHICIKFCEHCCCFQMMLDTVEETDKNEFIIYLQVCRRKMTKILLRGLA